MPVGFGLAGIGALVCGVVIVVSQRRFAQRSIQTVGTVIDIRSAATIPDSGYLGVTKVPLVRFLDHRGETIEFTSNVGSNPSRYRRGDTVAVRYPPSGPSEARIAGAGTIAFPAIFGVLGLVFVGASAVMMAATR